MALSHVVTQLIGASKGLVALGDHAAVPGRLMLPHVTAVITLATESGSAAERAMEAVVSVRLRRCLPVGAETWSSNRCDQDWGLRCSDQWLEAEVIGHAAWIEDWLLNFEGRLGDTKRFYHQGCVEIEELWWQ